MIYAGAYLNRKMPVFGWGTRRNHMVRKFRAEGETAFSFSFSFSFSCSCSSFSCSCCSSFFSFFSFFPPRYIIRPKVRRPSR